MADYTNRKLYQKLGFREGFRYSIIHEPQFYRELLGGMPDDCVEDKDGRHLDLVHFFPDSEAELRVELPELRSMIRQNGMIWISWPKKASKVATDLSSDVVRRTGLALDLVDSKVCSVNETWSAMKFVIPRHLRVEEPK